MKKTFALLFVGILCLSTFSMFSPLAKADTTLRAWKDATSLGLENDRLYIHGLAATGNYRWFFDYIIFKDTGTTWYQPWGELALLVYPNFQWNGASTTEFEVNAFTDADKAYLTYSITSGNLREELTYTIYPGEPYIYATLSLTNIGSTVGSTYTGIQFTTWIAGDHPNDYFYVPGHGQGQFNGVGNVNFPDATETWVAMWDQNKGEGCAMLSTEGFEPSNMITEDFGIGEGFKFISDNFDLAPSQTSLTYDCYLYFFKGTGSDQASVFYDRITSVDGVENGLILNAYNFRRNQRSFTIQQNFWIAGGKQLYWAQNIIIVFNHVKLMRGVFSIYNYTGGTGIKILFWSGIGLGTAKNTFTMRSSIQNGQLVMANDFASYSWSVPAEASNDLRILKSDTLPGWPSYEGGYKPEIVLVGGASVDLTRFLIPIPIKIIGHVDFLSPTNGHVETYLRIKNSGIWVHGLNTVIDSPSKSSTFETSSGLDWTTAGDFTPVSLPPTSNDEGLKFIPDYARGAVVPPAV